MEKAGTGIPARFPIPNGIRIDNDKHTRAQAAGGKFRAIMFDQSDDWASHYSSKLAARGGVMLHAVNLGWTLAECRAVFLNPANPGSALWTQGSHGQDHGPHEAARRLRADYERCTAKAVQDPVYSSGQEVRQELSAVRAAVADSVWRGRTGRTDRAVLMGILSRMIEVGSDRINFSERDTALRAGVTRDTARASLRRLVQAGLIERTRDTGPKGVSQLAPGPARADVIKVSSGPILTHINLKTSPGESYMDAKGATHGATQADHECWVQMGKSAAGLYVVLTGTPQSARTLADLAGVNRKTADRQLPKLAGYDLAVRQDDGWITGASYS